MSLYDATQRDRTARFLRVDVRRGSGSPPTHGPAWEWFPNAYVERIEKNPGAEFNLATIWFPEFAWHENPLNHGDRVRIVAEDDGVCIFSGFVTKRPRSFAGGDERQAGHDKVGVICRDHRWVWHVGSAIYGQVIHGPDDISTSDFEFTFLTGRRAVFNENGVGNASAYTLCVRSPLEPQGAKVCEHYIFTGDATAGWKWTARDMMRYVLSPLWNKTYHYIPVPDPALLIGLDHSDFNAELGNVAVEGLSPIQAAEAICKQIGWNFREEYYADGTATLIFYRRGGASAAARSTAAPTIRHTLYAPAVGEGIANAIAAGQRLISSALLADDIEQVVNWPTGLGGVHRFEFTAELVPAWLDTDLVPDTSDDLVNLFFTEAQIQALADPNAISYYSSYHVRGNNFKRAAGRKWCLNESGRYTGGSYDRGVALDWSSVLPVDYVMLGGKKSFGLFDRPLLECLTQDANGHPLPVKVEFSFDGGATWRTLPGTIKVLDQEGGIIIDEANLAEMIDKAGAAEAISGGTLDGVALNYWTSLADDKLEGRVFKTGGWHTRVRVTASVQMDMRLAASKSPAGSGSPFWQAGLFDMARKYRLQERAESSVLGASGLAADDVDESLWFDWHLARLRDDGGDRAISSQFVLERFWIGDYSTGEDFALGDEVAYIAGRGIDLASAPGKYPEIVRIVYRNNDNGQRQELCLGDTRYGSITRL